MVQHRHKLYSQPIFYRTDGVVINILKFLKMSKIMLVLILPKWYAAILIIKFHMAILNIKIFTNIRLLLIFGFNSDLL